MRAAAVQFYEVENRLSLPSSLTVGYVYFLKEEHRLLVNHGDKIVEYGVGEDIPLTGLPVDEGGTGATTPEGARQNLGALGVNDAAASAERLETPFTLNVVGAVNGSAQVDGSQAVGIMTQPGPQLELNTNRVDTIRPAGTASPYRYATEAAIRTELDKKIDQGTATDTFRGIFATGADLAAAIPQGQMGWYATVQATNTTWIWDGIWQDIGELRGEGIVTINGKSGADVILEAGDLGAYNKVEVDGLISTEATTRELVDTGLQSGIDTNTNNLQTLTNNVKVVQFDTRVFTQEINAVTDLPDTLIPPGAAMSPDITVIADAAGVLALYKGASSTVGNSLYQTIGLSVGSGNEPTLLGNVENYSDLPLTRAAAEFLFQRGIGNGDYARVLQDETKNGATVEYYILDLTNDNVTWGAPVVINTSDYQTQTTMNDNNKLLVGGGVPGTFGTSVDKNAFVKSADGLNMSITASPSSQDRAINTSNGSGYLVTTQGVTVQEQAISRALVRNYQLAEAPPAGGPANVVAAMYNTVRRSRYIQRKILSSFAGGWVRLGTWTRGYNTFETLFNINTIASGLIGQMCVMFFGGYGNSEIVLVGRSGTAVNAGLTKLRIVNANQGEAYLDGYFVQHTSDTTYTFDYTTSDYPDPFQPTDWQQIASIPSGYAVTSELDIVNGSAVSGVFKATNLIGAPDYSAPYATFPVTNAIFPVSPTNTPGSTAKYGTPYTVLENGWMFTRWASNLASYSTVVFIGSFYDAAPGIQNSQQGHLYPVSKGDIVNIGITTSADASAFTLSGTGVQFFKGR